MDDVIKNLIENYENEIRESEINDFSFLSVLNRNYDEDLISRILTYILYKDKQLMSKLLLEYCNDCEYILKNISKYNIIITPEKYMGIGRADIFIEIKDKNSVIATITIENKIYSNEHDNQTQTYYDWVTSKVLYKNSVNAFFYLRPYFNCSEAVCKKFKNITYTDLLNWINKNTDDYIIDDFCKHISDKFSKKEWEDIPMLFNEEQIYILNNYNHISTKLCDVREVFKQRKADIINAIEKKLKIDEFRTKREPAENLGTCSYRIYREEWDIKNFLFYVEIKFSTKNLREIFIQETIRDKSKQNIIKNFIEQEENLSLVEDPDGGYYVIKQEQIPSNISWEEENWHNKLIEEATRKLPNYIKEMDGIFNMFCEKHPLF